MMKPSLIILLIPLLLTSCDRPRPGKDTFTRDVALSAAEKEVYYPKIRYYEKELGLDSVINGYDSLQIRLWDWPEMITTKSLTVLKCQKGNWGGYHYYFNSDLSPVKLLTVEDTLSKILVSEKYVKREIEPLQGWARLLQDLERHNVFTLPGMERIPGLKDPYVDGHSYLVEIATPAEYRIYRYHEPEKFADKYPPAKDFVEILKILQVE